VFLTETNSINVHKIEFCFLKELFFCQEIHPSKFAKIQLWLDVTGYMQFRLDSQPRVHKAFQNKDQVKISYIMDFF